MPLRRCFLKPAPPPTLTTRPSTPLQNARDAIRDVLKGVAYLHSQGITHRDLKPENLLCEKKEFPLHVKVSDFGLSNFLDTAEEGNMLRTVCGSLSYIAPEMALARGYGPEVSLRSFPCRHWP